MSDAFGLLDAAVGPSTASLDALLAEVGAPGWSGTEFMDLVYELQSQQAASLLVDALHRSRAYSHEFMPIAEARALVADFIAAAGPGAVFYSTNRAAEEPRANDCASIVVLTESVFETIVYCVGPAEAALLLITEDD